MLNKLILLSIFLLTFSFSGQALDASITYCTFKGAGQNYVEIYIHVIGNTITYAPISTDSTMAQAGAEVVILFKQDGKIIKFDKYNLNSPINGTRRDFVDLKRFGLPDGKYELEVSVQDNHKAENAVRHQGKFAMNFPQDETVLQQSDIQLLSSVKATKEEGVLMKNGFYLEPLPFNFYYKNASKLIFYNEVYETDKKIGDDFQVSYGISRLANNKSETMMIGHKKRKPQAVNVLILKLDISELPSGQYELFVEIRNRAKELLSRKKVEFQRSNPYLEATHEVTEKAELKDEFVGKLTQEELRYGLRAVAPLVKEGDVELLNSVIKNPDSTIQQRFLFNFWVNQNPNQPDLTYDAFMAVAKAVDRMYDSGFGYGFETDRGYTYIRYGQPDDMIRVDNDPSAPPYEIWVYNDFKMTNQTNVKFLFYSPDLAADFKLLHSTARGEMNNPQWQLELYRNVPNEVDGNNYIDATQMQDNWNRHASRYFNEF